MAEKNQGTDGKGISVVGMKGGNADTVITADTVNINAPLKTSTETGKQETEANRGEREIQQQRVYKCPKCEWRSGGIKCPGTRERCESKLSKNQKFCTKCTNKTKDEWFTDESLKKDSSVVGYICPRGDSIIVYDDIKRCLNCGSTLERCIICPNKRDPCNHNVHATDDRCSMCGNPVKKTAFDDKCHETVGGRPCHAVIRRRDKCCPKCGHDVPESKDHVDDVRKNGIKCPGKRKPCKAKVSKNQRFCTLCKQEINQSWFNNGQHCNTGEPAESPLSGYACSKYDGICPFTSEDSLTQCLLCGSPLEKYLLCPRIRQPCENAVYPGEKFCSKCGWKVDNRFLWRNCSAGNGDTCLCPLRDEDKCCPQCGKHLPKGMHKCSIKHIGDKREDGKLIVCQVNNVENPSSVIRHILTEGKMELVFLNSEIKCRFNADLDEIRPGSLIFIFLHKTKESAQRMIDDKVKVADIIKDFLNKLNTGVHFTDLDIDLFMKTDESQDATEDITGGNISPITVGYLPNRRTDDEFQSKVAVLEMENAEMNKLILLITSADRQDKVRHLSMEIETLKLLDISCSWLLLISNISTRVDKNYRYPRLAEDICSFYQRLLIYLISEDTRTYLSPSSYTTQILAVKSNTPITEEKLLDAEEYVTSVLNHLREGLRNRTDLSGLLGDITRHHKNIIPHLQAKADYLTLVTSCEDRTCKTTGDSHLKELGRKRKTSSCSSPDTTAPKKSYISITDEETSLDLNKKLESLKNEKERLKEELRENTEGVFEKPLSSCDAQSSLEWENIMLFLSQEISNLKLKDVVTDIIEEEMLFMSKKQHPDSQSDDCCSEESSRHKSHVRRLRSLQHGALTRGDLFSILEEVITDDQRRMSFLLTETDRLENEYGSPVHMVGEIDSDHSGPVSCLPMTLSSERVTEDLAVSRDAKELVNTEWSGYDHHPDQFRRYSGTCGRETIPLSPSPSTPSLYWETHTQIEVKRIVGWMHLLEMGVCEEREMDTKILLSRQRRFWCVRVKWCDDHKGFCTRVYGKERQVGKCLTNTMSPTPGTDAILRYGIVLDTVRGRLAFLDVDQGRVLHKFQIRFTESLRPMFGVLPSTDGSDVRMRLVSGREINMSDWKKNAVARVLFSQ